MQTQNIILRPDFLNMLGLCARARRCVYGETACLAAVRAGKTQLLLVDAGASNNTKKRFEDACAFRNIPLIYYEKEKGDAAWAVGKPAHKLIAVSDHAFAKALQDLVQKDGSTQLGVEV